MVANRRKYIAWLIISFALLTIILLMIPVAIYDKYSSYFVSKAVYAETTFWQDKLWLLEVEFRNRMINLLSIDPDSGQIQRIDTSSGEHAFLLPDKDKLWIFVADNYSCLAGEQHITAFKYFSNGKVTDMPLKEQLENIT
ncbi:MAG: hypothetical protein A2Y62_19875 [Candidatus Fischerbacteria bacterium RBG_13_37_8]|uniref:Uncharacterized protein n=1 Tax=Candidatus Fischerbacteria bacterium RBG_13_37_8 TaxID=1817863 RepID=A0A1F5VNT9_9BACT|nr:MAG: hypothetical protein A2Y62_19875 [Candidatus Fischerbacteria bacterium RBG_13_37_8]